MLMSATWNSTAKTASPPGTSLRILPASRGSGAFQNVLERLHPIERADLGGLWSCGDTVDMSWTWAESDDAVPRRPMEALPRGDWGVSTISLAALDVENAAVSDRHEQVPTPVSRPGDLASSRSESASSSKGRWALSLITIAVAFLAGGTAGLAVGYAVASSSAANCTPSEQWCELGAALIGGAIGIVVGVVAYITVGVVLIVRHRPRGRRAGQIAIHLVAPVVVVALAAALQNVLAMVL